jgi:hypothetical protein
MNRSTVVFVASWLALSATYCWGQLDVLQLTPRPNALNAPLDSTIRIEFDRPLDPATVSSSNIGAFGRWSGPVGGTLQLADNNQTILFDPDANFTSGDLVSVNLSDGLLAADGSSLPTGSFSQQFWTRSQRVTNLSYTQIDVMPTGPGTRPYGGVATDLNNDGWLDITAVNEDTADLRVYMNRADGSGLFHPYTSTPTTSIGDRASPSEPADFNGDGNADLAVVNINDNSVSIVLGNGDGTFAPQQEIAVGQLPRGIAVLDFDGDGDADVVNSNANSSTLSLIENLGNGVFSNTPTTIDAGVTSEWSLMAGDMNNDGISDLVVGSGGSSQIRVLSGNGDGTFTPEAIASTGGRSWQISLGDVNGDGNIDVASANAQTGNGSILLGNGDGTFGTRSIYNVASMGSGSNGFPLASDLGDLDGDGDLDWITSSFNGEWVVLENDGTGNFDFFTELSAPAAASCSLMADFDNDGDLDLAMFDEIDDVIIIRRNDGVHCAMGDFDCDGSLNAADIDALVAAIAGDQSSLVFDLTGDGETNYDDLVEWLALGGAANLASGNSYLFGDANLDGSVDGNDFLAWNGNKFTNVAAWTGGDFNADGIVNGVDFLDWNANKFISADVQPVPEPHAMWVSLLLIATCGRRKFQAIMAG